MTTAVRSSPNERKRTTPRWWPAAALVAVLVAVGASAAACTGGGSHPVASPSRSANNLQSSTARENGVLYASCMRSHGVPNFPDPGPDGFNVPRGVKQEPQFQSAAQACQADAPTNGASPKQVNTQEELDFSRCMRSHGIIDFPDPLPGGGWDVPGDTNSARFQAAAQACRVTGIHWDGP